MGIRDWFKRSESSLKEVTFPGEEYSSPLEAIAAMIEAYQREGDSSAWVSFVATGKDGPAIIEVADGRINFCNRPVNLVELLRTQSLGALADRVKAGGRNSEDQTCWRLADATSPDLAVIVDTVFANEFRLGQGYQVRGERQS